MAQEVADFGIEGQLEAAAVEAALDELGAELLVGEEHFPARGRIELGFAGGGVDGRRGAVEDVAAEAVAELGREEIDQHAADAGGVEAPAAGGAQDGVEGEDEIALRVPVPAGEVEAEDEGVGQAVPALEEDLGDGGGADVHAGSEVAGDGADEEAGEVGDGLPAALGVPAIPAGDVEGVLEHGEVGLQGVAAFGFLGSSSPPTPLPSHSRPPGEGRKGLCSCRLQARLSSPQG